MLTNGQKEFLRFAEQWLTEVGAFPRESLRNNNRFAVLTGFPGTGKSTVVVELIKRLQTTQSRILLTAPTHFAKNVLGSFLESQNVRLPVSTIYSVLGIRPEINVLGEESFIQSDEPVDFSEYDLLIVDEASMVNRYLWAILTTTVDLPPTLFVGDRYQLRPVNCSVSPVFTKLRRGFALTEVVRHHGLIVDYLAALRDTYEVDMSPEVSPSDFMGDDTVIYCNYEEFLTRILAAMQGSDTYKVLAYTNKNVDYLNDLLKRFEMNDYNISIALEDCKEYGYSRDEKLILREPLLRWNSLRKREEIVCNNGTTVNVACVDSTTFRGFNCSVLTVWWIEPEMSDDNNEGDEVPSSFRTLKILFKEETIYILDSGENDKYQLRLSQLKAEALAHPAYSRQRTEAFKSYYQLKKTFTNVSRIYASTVHKAQGATFDVVFLHSDIAKCITEENRKELQYVGASRAKKQLVICNEDNSNSITSRVDTSGRKHRYTLGT